MGNVTVLEDAPWGACRLPVLLRLYSRDGERIVGIHVFGAAHLGALERGLPAGMLVPAEGAAVPVVADAAGVSGQMLERDLFPGEFGFPAGAFTVAQPLSRTITDAHRTLAHRVHQRRPAEQALGGGVYVVGERAAPVVDDPVVPDHDQPLAVVLGGA